MKAEERRKQILEFFRGQSGPVSASALADRFSVSRQIIVGDVALLRASGMNIEATPRGYILTEEQKKGILRRVACAHNREQMEDELNICVDYGCEVLNVIVEHPVTDSLRVNCICSPVTMWRSLWKRCGVRTPILCRS